MTFWSNTPGAPWLDPEKIARDITSSANTEGNDGAAIIIQSVQEF